MCASGCTHKSPPYLCSALLTALIKQTAGCFYRTATSTGGTIHWSGIRGAWDTQQIESARDDECLTINAE